MKSNPSKSSPGTRTPGRLNKELVVDAALRILRRGPGPISLRAVARELGVTPMALYRHVPNKQALLDEMQHSLRELLPLLDAPERGTPRAEQALSEDEIVDAALEIVRGRGLVALNMRDLAGRLDVTPMALYRRVPNKDSLLSLMSDRLLLALPRPPADPERWQDDFRAHALRMWRLFSAYPGLVGAFASGPSETVLANMQYEYTLLSASGADPQRVALVLTTYQTFALGLYRTQAYLVFLARGRKAPGVDPDLIRRFGTRLPLEDLLHTELDALLESLRPQEPRTPRRRPGGPPIVPK